MLPPSMTSVPFSTFTPPPQLALPPVMMPPLTVSVPPVSFSTHSCAALGVKRCAAAGRLSTTVSFPPPLSSNTLPLPVICST